MKKIEAIIREENMDAVKEALAEAGFPGLTVYEVHGRGEQQGILKHFRGHEYRIDMLPKVKFEIICEDEEMDKITDLIISHARTGAIGDGRIFISTIEDSIRIRTGERRNVETH